MPLSRVSNWRARSADMPSLDNQRQQNLRSTARLDTNIPPVFSQQKGERQAKRDVGASRTRATADLNPLYSPLIIKGEGMSVMLSAVAGCLVELPRLRPE